MNELSYNIANFDESDNF